MKKWKLAWLTPLLLTPIIAVACTNQKEIKKEVKNSSLDSNENLNNADDAHSFWLNIKNQYQNNDVNGIAHFLLQLLIHQHRFVDTWLTNKYQFNYLKPNDVNAFNYYLNNDKKNQDNYLKLKAFYDVLNRVVNENKPSLERIVINEFNDKTIKKVSFDLSDTNKQALYSQIKELNLINTNIKDFSFELNNINITINDAFSLTINLDLNTTYLNHNLNYLKDVNNLKALNLDQKAIDQILYLLNHMFDLYVDITINKDTLSLEELNKANDINNKFNWYTSMSDYKQHYLRTSDIKIYSDDYNSMYYINKYNPQKLLELIKQPQYQAKFNQTKNLLFNENK